jgi:23S rRNA pseudouridine2605 synthase
MTLSQGINRQIRRMCRDLELTVLRLKRIQMGPLHLGKLATGKVKVLSPRDAAALRKAVGL